MNYIPLGIKTHYELLNSLISIDEVIKYAKDNNIPSIGIADTSLSYVCEFYEKCKINKINPIIGLEACGIYLYAKNYIGYKSLCALTNKEEIAREDIIKHTEGVIAVVFTGNDYEFCKSHFEQLYFCYKDNESKKLALKYTNDLVYVKAGRYFIKEDEEYLKYLNLIKDNKNIDYINEYSFDEYIESDVSIIDAETTNAFSKLFNITIPRINFSLPQYSKDSYERISELCKKGLYKRRNGILNQNYIERLSYELSIIKSMGFVDYFLIVYDFVLYAKKNGIIIGPGRGSAAGSLVSYCLGITDVDPLEYGLIFERFLNPERVTMPDIDIDIEHSRRDEVVDYMINKYGADNVMHIVTYSIFSPKQSIIDVGKMLDINNVEINRICKLIKPNDTFDTLLTKNEFMSYINSKSIYRKLLDISKRFSGLKRSKGIHAAGIVVNNNPIYAQAPITYQNGIKCVAHTKDYLDYYGLIKIDLLALENLTIYKNITLLIKDDIKYNYSDIKTFNIFNNKLTYGIFQFDSRSMQELLNILKVTSFDDIVALNALNRPGPRDNTILYAKGKNNPNTIRYVIPELQTILSSTYGVIIYQEQIMQIFNQIAGYTYSEADNIRRAIGKKNEEVIKTEQTRFIDALKQKNISEKNATDIYSLILKFANYGFNKSHSVAYSLISYKLAYLKANYPLYFYKVMLNNTMNNSSLTNEIIKEVRLLGLKLSSISINISCNEYLIENDKLIYPLNIINGLNKDIINSICEERKKRLFKDFVDCAKRIYSDKINHDIFILLIKSGAFDEFGYNRNTLEKNLDKVINYVKLCEELGNNIEQPEIIKYAEKSKEELYKDEIKIFGFYITSHPVMEYDRRNSVLTKDITKYFDKYISIIGLIEDKKEIVTKKGEVMCFIRISDEFFTIDATIFPKEYKKLSEIKKSEVKLFTGHVEKRLDKYQLIISKIENI